MTELSSNTSDKLNVQTGRIMPLILYFLLVCSTTIAMPPGGLTYLVQRLLQMIELLFFILLNIKLIHKYRTIALDKFQFLIHLWWMTMIVLSFVFVRPVQLSEVNHWLNVCIFLLMINIYWKTEMYEHLRILVFLFSMLVYLNGLLFVMYPDGLWYDDTWVGTGDKSRYLFGNYNQTGMVVLLALMVNGVYSICFREGRVNMIFLMIVGVVTVFAMGSMTSTVGLLIVALYFMFRRLVKHPYAIITFFLVMYILFFVLVVWGGTNIEEMPRVAMFVENVLGKDSTFTSRVSLWLMSVRMILSAPLLGYGPQGPDWMVQNIGGSGPHNLWLMMLLQGGLFIMGGFILILGKIFKTFFKERLPWGAYALVCICVLMLMSLFETYNIVCVFMFLIIAYYSKYLSEYN